jgi:hypothetical protein
MRRDRAPIYYDASPPISGSRKTSLPYSIGGAGQEWLLLALPDDAVAQFKINISLMRVLLALTYILTYN